MNREMDLDGDLYYAARYEELLLQQRTYRECFLQHSAHTEDSQKASIGVASLLTNHAEMITMLNCAVQSAKVKAYWAQNENGQNHGVEALENLADESWNRHLYEFDNQDSRGSMSFASLVTLSALQRCDEVPMKDPIAAKAFLDDKPTNIQYLVDAFFQEYPECVRTDFKKDDGDPEEDYDNLFLDMDLMNRNEKTDTNNSRNTSHSAFYARAKSDPQQSSSSSDGYRSRSAPFDVQAPYGYNNNANNNINANSYYNSKDISNTQASNPYRASFKTAKEYAMDSKNDKVSHVGNGSGGHPSQNQQPSFDYGPSDTDPWGSFTPVHGSSAKVSGAYSTTNYINHPTDETTTTNNVSNNRNALSAGLKRKFQLPKPRTGLGNSTQNDKGSGGTAVKSQSHRSNGGSDEEDTTLPEELKGLDKELISKIEMEIVDSGDPVSFADIAGLADAKQTVMELVCWPMKRPDLFTGLRRGPNGLLLFGQVFFFFLCV